MCKKVVEMSEDIHRQEETIPDIKEDLKPFKKGENAKKVWKAMTGWPVPGEASFLERDCILLPTILDFSCSQADSVHIFFSGNSQAESRVKQQWLLPNSIGAGSVSLRD